MLLGQSSLPKSQCFKTCLFLVFVFLVFFLQIIEIHASFLSGHQVTKRHSDEACLAENLASAKWRCDAASLESKGQPEDRWQANHVENESCGKCTGHGWRPLRGVHLALTGPGLTWNKTSSLILHYVCQLAPSPRDTPTTLFSVQLWMKINTPPLEA